MVRVQVRQVNATKVYCHRRVGGNCRLLVSRSGGSIDAPICEELTTSSFRGQTRKAQGNVKRNRRGRRGGARRIYPQEYKRRRGRGCRSECRVDSHLKGAMKEMDEVGSEDEGDDYQGGI